MAMNTLSKRIITGRIFRRNGVKSPSVLSSLESNLETKDAKVAGKRKRGTEKMMPNKRGRDGNVPDIKQTFVSFDFGPEELNCHRFVSTRLQCVLDSGDLNIQLEFGKELLLIHHSDISVGDLCVRHFGSQPSCIESQKDGAVPKNTVVVCCVDETLEKNELSKELVANLSKSVEKGHLFFVRAENGWTSTGSFLEKYKIKVSPNQIITRKAQMLRVYEKMYEDIEGKFEYVKKAIDTLPQSEIHPIRRKIACIEKKLKERKKPKGLSEKCKKELESALDFGVIAYRTDSESLTVYINRPWTRSLNAKLRDLEKNCSPLVLRCCRVQTPIYRPHLLRAGCQVKNGDKDISGTIGIFAKQILEDAEKDVAITSAHVIWEGCNARVHVEGSDEEIGHCIWPLKPPGEYLEAKLLDMAVIKMKSDITEHISTSENVSVYTDQKDKLECRKVYKCGWKTGETHGDIHFPQFNMFGKKVMVITTADGRNFSEPGDSGALVLTKNGTQLHALGLIFGGGLRLQENDEDFPDNASLAIYLDVAISRFEEENERGKIKIQRY
ncbi:uncharacterized protein LOC125662787 [Ostrea edulis]|uniref:uncharacterized protein LOC125662787 n=1 Tax=Ostrea edulis TaxID=37623 RepID=UPI002095CA79|nr:uncharacterized protein LOC125662787 [Ostrea edulis]